MNETAHLGFTEELKLGRILTDVMNQVTVFSNS